MGVIETVLNSLDTVPQLFLRDPLLFYAVAVIGSLFIIFKSADYLVDSVSSYSRKLGMSYSLTGLIVVAMAASTPEVFTSLVGALKGEEGIAFGTILGTNMVHLALVVGFLAVLAGRMKIDSELLGKSKLFLWCILMLPFLLLLDGTLSRFDGGILLLAFCLYLVRLWRAEGSLGRIKKNVKITRIWRDGLTFCLGLIALLIASILLVFGASGLARVFHIPPYFIAITVIAVGATLPDFAVAFRAVRKGYAELGIGDTLGSVCIELLLYFGLLGLFHPFAVPLSDIGNALVFLPLSITLLLLLLRRKEMTAAHGVAFLGIYAAFFALEALKILG